MFKFTSVLYYSVLGIRIKRIPIRARAKLMLAVWARFARYGSKEAIGGHVLLEKRRPANGVCALGSASDTSELRALKFLAQPVLKFIAGAV